MGYYLVIRICYVCVVEYCLGLKIGFWYSLYCEWVLELFFELEDLGIILLNVIDI